MGVASLARMAPKKLSMEILAWNCKGLGRLYSFSAGKVIEKRWKAPKRMKQSCGNKWISRGNCYDIKTNDEERGGRRKKKIREGLNRFKGTSSQKY